jgi:PAS domain S-box-containing protein
MRMMHKIKFLLLLAYPVILFCTSLHAQESTSSSSDQRVFKIKGDHYYPPYEFLNEKGEPDGFNVELFREIASSLDIHYELKLGSWKTIREELETGQIDAVLGMMISPQRAEKIVFGVPHSVMTHGIFTHKDKEYFTLDELRGKEIIVQSKDLMHEFLLESGLTDKIILAGSQLEALQILASGKHDAALIGNFQGSHIIKQYKLDNIKVRSSSIEPQKYAMAVSTGNDELIWLLNHGLYQMKVNGTYDELYEKWFGIYESNYFIRTYKIAIISVIGIIVILSIFIFLLRFQVRKATRELKASEEKYRLLIDNQNDLIIKIDYDGRFLFVSPSYCKLFGKQEDELLGKKFLPLLHEDDREAATHEMQKLNMPPYTAFVEQRALTNMGWRWIAWSYTAILGNDKKADAIVGIGRDITERKHTETELQKAKENAEESDRLKTAFLNNISHEIRTPLNGILGFTELINNPNTPIDKREFYARIINQSSIQLLSIIDDIINIATIEAGQEKIRESPTDVSVVMKNIYEQFKQKAESKHLDFNFHSSLSRQESQIICDGTKLTQILSNIVGNAIKFANKGHAHFSCWLKDDVLHFCIEDSGIGIPVEDQELIFERFRQVYNNENREYGGNGLGLSISRAYIHLLGGRIWVESEPQKGSKFHFTIPYKPVDVSTDRAQQSNNAISELSQHGTKTILLAEDEYSNFVLLKVILQTENFKIIHVDDGEKAVEAVDKNTDINLVLMDLKMPVMNGLEATRLIKRQKPQLPVIALTAYAFEGDTDKALEAGCDDYIAKPFGRDDLLYIINKHLH